MWLNIFKTIWNLIRMRFIQIMRQIIPNSYIKVKLSVTLVEGDQKAPFSIATTLRYWERALLLSLDCSILLLICTLYCWVLSKEVSSTIFKVFSMTRPVIEPRSPGPLANKSEWHWFQYGITDQNFVRYSNSSRQFNALDEPTFPYKFVPWNIGHQAVLPFPLRRIIYGFMILSRALA